MRLIHLAGQKVIACLSSPNAQHDGMSGAGPMVGIFWGVPVAGGVALVIEATTLADAEPYGDRLTHANGHAETWAAWQRMGTAELVAHALPAAICQHEYDDVPRGRVVAERDGGAITIYADRALLGARMRDRIRAAFSLKDTVAWWTDQHYRTGRRGLS